MLASTSRNRRDILSRASASMNSCRPSVTLLCPSACARSYSWPPSGLFWTACRRTIKAPPVTQANVSAFAPADQLIDY